MNTLTLLSDAKYLQESGAKMAEIRELLDSRDNKDKLEAMKRITGMMTLGRNASIFFPDVVKNVVVDDIELKKLVYMYIVKYSEENQDLALLSINSLQKDLAPGLPPRIRASALRALASIRVPVVVTVLIHSIAANIEDPSPYVRKAAAAAIPKVYDLDPEQQSTCADLISRLLCSVDPDVLGHALFAFDRVCPRQFDILHPHYRKLCHLLADLDEWAQMTAIKVLGAYARHHFAKPAGYLDITTFDPDSTDKNIYAVLGVSGASKIRGLVEAAVAAGLSQLVGAPEDATPGTNTGSSSAYSQTGAKSASNLSHITGGSATLGGSRSGFQAPPRPATILSKYAHDASQPFFDDDKAGSDEITDSDMSDDTESDTESDDEITPSSDEESDEERAKRKRRKEKRKAKRAAAKAKRAAARAKRQAEREAKNAAKLKAQSGGSESNILPLDVFGSSNQTSKTNQTSSIPSLVSVLGVPTQPATPSAQTASPSSTAPSTGTPATNSSPGIASSNAIEPDLAILLRAAALMLRSPSAGVVVAIAGLYQSIAPLEYFFPCCKALVHHARAGRATAYSVQATINTLASHVPELFTQFYTDFYVSPADPGFIKALKVDTLSYLSTPRNFKAILQELQVYLGSPDKVFVTKVVSAMTRVASKYSVAVAPCVQILMALIASSNDDVVARAVLAIRVLLQRVPDETLPAVVIEQLARAVELVKAPTARAALVSVVARYHARIPDLAPEVLRILAKDFINEEVEVKTQILNLACVLFLVNQQKLAPLFKYIMDLCKYDVSFDLRDQARLLRVLFFKKRRESSITQAPTSSPTASSDGTAVDNSEVKEMLKQVLQMPNPASLLPQVHHERDTFYIGTLSHLVSRPTKGYAPLPQFPATSTPASVRDKPVELKAIPTLPGKSAPQKPGVTSATASKGKASLDQFYASDSGDDSDSESTSEEESDSDETDDNGYVAQKPTSAFSAFGTLDFGSPATPAPTPNPAAQFGNFGNFGAFGVESTSSPSNELNSAFGAFGAFGAMSPPSGVTQSTNPTMTFPDFNKQPVVEEDPFAAAVGDVSSAFQPAEGFGDFTARPSPAMANVTASPMASPPATSAFGKFGTAQGNTLAGFGFSNLSNDSTNSFDIFSQKR